MDVKTRRKLFQCVCVCVWVGGGGVYRGSAVVSPGVFEPELLLKWLNPAVCEGFAPKHYSRFPSALKIFR